MKKLTPSEYKEIAYNCKRATFLIEKQQVEDITFRENLELRIHLAGCSICVTFMRQSAIINQMAQKLFHSDFGELKLDGEFKERLQQRINSRLNTN